MTIASSTELICFLVLSVVVVAGALGVLALLPGVATFPRLWALGLTSPPIWLRGI